MPNRQIAADATILTVHDRLDDPEGYVRAVLDRLWACKRQNGDAQVRIGILSGATAPDYRLETIMDPETGQSVTIEGYSGKTHRQLAFDKIDDYRLWSSESVVIDMVANLLGEIRNFKRRKR